MATPTMGISSDTAYDFNVVLVGGLTSGYHAVFMDKKPVRSSVLTRLPFYGWIPLEDLYDFSVCAAPDGFIVSGGTDIYGIRTLSDVKRFSIKDQTWTDLPDMLYPCSYQGSVCVNNRFFTVGGLLQKGSVINCYSVCMLDLDTLAWAECQSLETSVRFPSVAAADTDILVIGSSSNQTCKYDSHTGKRTECQPMPKECSPYNRTVAVGKRVFVLDYDATLFLVYNVVTDQWSELPCPVRPVKNSAMVLFNGRLVVTGGRSHEEKYDTVQTYDVENKIWWLEKDRLPLPLYGHAAIVVKVPHSWRLSLLSRFLSSSPLILCSLILPVLLILCYLFLW